MKRISSPALIIMAAIAFVIIVCVNPKGKENNNIQTNTTATIDTFELEGGVFEYNALVIITSDTGLAADFVRRNFDSTETGATFIIADGYTFSDDSMGLQPVIWLSKFPETPQQFSNAMHELMHLTYVILHWVQIELTEDTKEVYAYELGYLSKQFFEHCASKLLVNKRR